MRSALRSTLLAAALLIAAPRAIRAQQATPADTAAPSSMVDRFLELLQGLVTPADSAKPATTRPVPDRDRNRVPFDTVGVTYAVGRLINDSTVVVLHGTEANPDTMPVGATWRLCQLALKEGQVVRARCAPRPITVVSGVTPPADSTP